MENIHMITFKILSKLNKYYKVYWKMSESINHTHDCGDEELKIEDLKLRYATFLHVLLINCF